MEISVIIPMRNAAHTIIQTLRGLENQTVKDFEAIIVDDGSTDSSPELVAQFKESSELQIRLIHQKQSGPAAARNRGVEHSNGGVVIFLDSDCIPPPNWVEAMVSPLHGDVVGCNCGYKVKNSGSLVARYVDYEIAKRHEKVIGRNIDAFGSYSASFLKTTFKEVGGFKTEYTAANAEDFELGFSIKKAGYKIIFTGKTFVYHFHPDSLKRYLKQQFSRGYWRVRLYLRNKDRIMGGDSYTGHEAQLQFVLSTLALVSLPLIIINPYLVIITFGVLLISNLSLGLWSFHQEKKFLLLAPALASLRSLAGTIGAYAYVVENSLNWLKGKSRYSRRLSN